MNRAPHRSAALALFAAALGFPMAAQAQGTQGEGAREPYRYRVGLGPQLVPGYPGSDGVVVRPLIEFSRARGDDPFEFEAGDESATIKVIDLPGFALGPAFTVEGSRKRRETGAAIDEVGATFELGGFAQAWVAPSLRLHGELRKGLGGHRGMIGSVGLDYVMRDGDRWLFALGPRVSLSDAKYQDAFFRITPREAAASGLPAYDPGGGGVHAAGAAATMTYQFTRRLGVYGYAKYDRLVGDAADSPVVRELGSRNQVSGGAALTITFGKGVR